MKLVIYTQHRENYGTPENPYWKMKCGDIYVVENLSMIQAQRATVSGCPVLVGLIQQKTTMFEEYILDISAVSDDKVICDPWKNPIKLSYSEGRWNAVQITPNGEYGWMKKDIAAKVVEWPLGHMEEARVIFELVDGRVMCYNEYQLEQCGV